MIIAFTSDMIPRLVYYWSFSVFPYGESATHTMEGYILSSLSVFNTSDFSSDSRPLGNFTGISSCRWAPLFPFVWGGGNRNKGSFRSRYRDFRFPPGHPRQYQFSMRYWHVVAAKLAFIIVVEVGQQC